MLFSGFCKHLFQDAQCLFGRSVGSGSAKHPLANVAISFNSCGNEDKSLVSIDSYLSPSSNPGQDLSTGTLQVHLIQVACGGWDLGEKKKDEWRWKLSVKDRPAFSGPALRALDECVSIERLPSEKQQVCCWWADKYRAQELCRACRPRTKPGAYFSVCGHLSSH